VCKYGGEPAGSRATELVVVVPTLRPLLYTCVCVYVYVNNKTSWRYSSDEPWPAEQPPLAVFPDCTRRYWVDKWSAHRIPQLHFQLFKPDRYFFIQVTTQFIR
jgi:hypothetical protein